MKLSLLENVRDKVLELRRVSAYVRRESGHHSGEYERADAMCCAYTNVLTELEAALAAAEPTRERLHRALLDCAVPDKYVIGVMERFDQIADAVGANPALPGDVRSALEWIRDCGEGDTVGVYDRGRFLARRLLALFCAEAKPNERPCAVCGQPPDFAKHWGTVADPAPVGNHDYE